MLSDGLISSKESQLNDQPEHEPHPRAASVAEYRAPRAFRIGTATALVRGYTSYKYSDGYTGYTWER